MTLLLDTHALLWWFVSPDRLSASVAAALEAGKDVNVSAVSAYEMAQKRFQEPELLEFAPSIMILVERSGFTWTPLTAAQAHAAGRLSWEHRDPFDRMLVAQALDIGATLVTIDRHIRAYDVPTLW